MLISLAVVRNPKVITLRSLSIRSMPGMLGIIKNSLLVMPEKTARIRGRAQYKSISSGAVPALMFLLSNRTYFLLA
ncbi:MAG TPA: hypothetical protein VIF86_06780 [Methylobacter sp.]|jgi:hypothetical protein